MIYLQPSQVLGFHSCEKEVALSILNGSTQLRPSDNPWDWLGPGIYFWEFDPNRALHYAMECATGKQKFSGRINTPFVMGAIIELGNCLNLTESNSIGIVKDAYFELEKTLRQYGQTMPKNRGSNRVLDCSVIKFIHASNKNPAIPRYDTVRSHFQEGEPIYDGSNFTSGSHVEVCVLNPEQIIGYFLPQPVEDFNPYLLTEFRRSA